MATPSVPSARPSFLQSDRLLARAAQPLVRFLHVEAAGGILLVVASVAALAWANSPWQASYESFWSTSIRVEIGPYLFEEDLLHVVNDLLMAVFFFVVGMEIKRELVVGELRDRRAVVLPADGRARRHGRSGAHLHGVQCRWRGRRRVGHSDGD